MYVLSGEGERKVHNSSCRQMISSLCSNSLSFNCWSSDRNSLRMSEIRSIFESSVFLLVFIMEPPSEVLSEIDTTLTVRNCGGGMVVEILLC